MTDDRVEVGPLIFEAWSKRPGGLVAIQVSTDEELLSYIEWLTEDQWNRFKHAAKYGSHTYEVD